MKKKPKGQRAKPRRGKLVLPVVGKTKPAAPSDLETLERLVKKFPNLLQFVKGNSITVGEVIGQYLEHGIGELCPEAAWWREHILKAFAAKHGGKLVSQCKPLDLLTWIKGQSAWNSNWTRKGAAAGVRAAFGWAESMGLIEDNPFRKLKCPAGEIRRAMTDPEFRAILRNSNAPFRRFLLCLRWTGMRPKEAMNLKWSDVDLDRGLIVLTVHKTRRKTGRPRIIPLIPPLVRLLKWIKDHPRSGRRELVDMLRLILTRAGGRLSSAPLRRQLDAIVGYHVDCWALYQAAKRAGIKTITHCPHCGKKYRFHEKTYELGNSSGDPADVFGLGPTYVFLNKKGSTWKASNVSFLLRRIRKKTGISEDCFIYGARHAFATDAILNGVNMKMVSTLLGHSDSRTTEAHYVHVAGLVGPLAEAMKQAAQTVVSNGQLTGR